MVTLAVSGTVFEILMLKGKKWLILPTPTLFEAPTRGTPSEFRDETYPWKTRGMGLLYGENCVILASTVFDWSTHVTDRRTDGIAMAYTRYSIYDVARKYSNHDDNNNVINKDQTTGFIKGAMHFFLKSGGGQRKDNATLYLSYIWIMAAKLVCSISILSQNSTHRLQPQKKITK